MEQMRLARITNVTELAPIDHGRQRLNIQMILQTDEARSETLEVTALYPVPGLLAAFNVESVRDLRGLPAIAVTDDVSGFVHGFMPTGPEPALFPGRQ